MEAFLFGPLTIPKVSRPDQVLIKVAYAGISKEDIMSAKDFGVPKDKETFSTLPGRGLSGIVKDTGTDVKCFEKEDKVVVEPDLCRNKEIPCENVGCSEYVVVPMHKVHKIPDAVSLQQAVLVAPLSHLIHGWETVNPIPIGTDILIIGAGCYSALWACTLHHYGHRRVTITDQNPHNLDLIKKLDTGFRVIPPKELSVDQQSSFQYIYDLIIDCTGDPQTIKHGLAQLRKGGKLCCFSVDSSQTEFNLNPFEVFMRELKIFGAHDGHFSFPKALALMEAMEHRYLSFDKLGIKMFKLNQYEEAIKLLKDELITEAVFNMK